MSNWCARWGIIGASRRTLRELRLLAHPGPKSNLPEIQNRAVTLAIGPEGGWTDFEIDLLTAQHFQPWSIGSRILRSDTATIGLLAILNYLM